MYIFLVTKERRCLLFLCFAPFSCFVVVVVDNKKKGGRGGVDVEKRGVYQRSYTYSRALCDSLF